MNLILKRRRFGQLALASAATTVLSSLAAKTVAQQSQSIIYGVSLDSASSSVTEDMVDASAANQTPALVLQPLDLATGQGLSTTKIAQQSVGNQQEATNTISKGFLIKKPSERITGIAALSDNTFIIAASAATKQGNFTRFIFYDPASKKPSKALKAKNLEQNNSIESLLAIKNDQIIAIRSLNQGQLPFDLVAVNSNSGQVDSGAALSLPILPLGERFSNLAQSPDGTIYSTNMGSEGVVVLVQFDLANTSAITGRGKINRLVPLKFNGRPLRNDLACLAFSPSNQLFALADPQREGTNSLFTVDPKTGEMQLLRKFAVDRIAFSKA